MVFLCTGVSDRNFSRDCVTCQVDYWLGELSGELHRRYQKQVVDVGCFVSNWEDQLTSNIPQKPPVSSFLPNDGFQFG